MVNFGRAGMYFSELEFFGGTILGLGTVRFTVCFWFRMGHIV